MESFASEDQEILRIARELCSKVQTNRIDPQTVTWARQVPSDECRFSPGFRRRGIMLSVSLKGKLKPEEWKPLIASSLVRQKIVMDSISRRALTEIMFPTLLGGGGLVLLILLTRGLPALIMVLSVLSYSTLVLLLLGQRSLRGSKNLTFSADRLSAEMVGKDSLVAVLQKIERLNPPDVERRKKGGPFITLAFRPSVIERLDKLVKSDGNV